MHKIVAGEIIINSVRSKFDPLLAAFAGNIDILLITETKIDTIFPKIQFYQFYLNAYNVSYRLDRNTNGGGILFYFLGEIK